MQFPQSPKHPTSASDFDLAKQDLDYVQSAKAAVMMQQPRGASLIIWAGVLFFLVTLIWMYVAEVDQVVRGQGKVIPASQVQQIQNLEGGIVKDILVKEGDQVQEGQVIARIDDTRYTSSYAENQKKRQSLEIKTFRLKAESTGDVFLINGLRGYDPEILGSEQSLYVARKRNLYQNKQVLKLQYKQAEEDQKNAEANLEQIRRAIKLLERELRIKRPLLKQGVISEVELLQLERDYSNQQGELEKAKSAIEKAKSALVEIQEQIVTADAKFQQDANQELADTQTELQRIIQSMKAIEDQVKRTEVLSPVTGIVQKINVNTLGGVLRAGDVLMEIVPQDNNLVIESRIAPGDIAFISPGQDAVVKITAYDFAVYGGLQGSVVNISADTFLDEKTGNPYYTIRVKTKQSYLGTADQPKPIIPGMVAEVGVVTGKKRILEYLLKPVIKAKDVALTER